MRIKTEIVVIGFLLLVLLSLLGRSFTYDLIWDDHIYIQERSFFFTHHSLFDAFKVGFFLKPAMSKATYYRPLVIASFFFESKLWGLHKWSMRAANFIIYFLSLIIFYLFLKSWIQHDYFPEMTIVLFAFHPINVDNILWCVGRCDLFLLLWYGLVLLFLEKGISKNKTVYLFYSFFFFSLGLLSKESIVFLLPTLVVYELVRRRRLTWLYQIANVIAIVVFFLVKINIIGIRNLNLVFYSTLLKNLKILLLTAGYYFKSIIIPYHNPMFIPESTLVSFKYIFFGSLFTVFVLVTVILAWKKKELWFPLSLVISVIGGHLFLVFTMIYPFKIYSRYMMVATLGAIIIFILFLQYWKSSVKPVLIGLVIISFIPSFLFNSYAYKSEWSYFQRAKNFLPDNDFINYQLAKIKKDKHDYISTELILNQMLFRPMRKTTAMLVSLMYADIEFTRAAYGRSLRWVESIQGFEQPYLEFVPFIKFQMTHQKAMIAMVTGKFKEAEKLFRKNIKNYDGMRASYDELYLMLVGKERWTEASNLEEAIREKFNTWERPSTSEVEKQFQRLSLNEKMEFYILHRNYSRAIELLEKKNDMTLKEQFQLAKLYYRIGQESKGNQIVEHIYFQNKENYEVLNMIGSFLIIDFVRIPQGLFYLEQSLRLNPGQQNIKLLVMRLRKEYLEIIKNPWNHKRLSKR